MKAVILAAGVGSRLRPLTSNKPKPAVTVGGIPILKRQLYAYYESDVRKITVVTGYRSDRIEKICNDVKKELGNVKISTVKNEKYEETENMYSLYLAREFVEGEEFMLSNGDVVFSNKIVHRMASNKSGNSYISSDKSFFSEESMKIKVRQGRVKEITKQMSREESSAVSTDIYRFGNDFSSELFKKIRKKVLKECYSGWTEKIINLVLKEGNKKVIAQDVDEEHWVEIDDIYDLRKADRLFSKEVRLEDKEIVFFDLDGTIYLEDEKVEGSADVIDKAKKNDTKVYFLSNNSSEWVDNYVQKLASMGIEVESESIILSTHGVIEYLNGENIKEAFVVGTKNMKSAIESNGINVESTNPTHVVVGFDKELTYEKVKKASIYIQNGARFLLAHPDEHCPTPDGNIPDCGSIGALLSAATESSPDLVFGKPNPSMISHILDEYNVNINNILIVGDSLQSDGEMARKIGCKFVCVLSGRSTREEVERRSLKPDLIADDVSALA